MEQRSKSRSPSRERVTSTTSQRNKSADSRKSVQSRERLASSSPAAGHGRKSKSPSSRRTSAKSRQTSAKSRTGGDVSATRRSKSREMTSSVGSMRRSQSSRSQRTEKQEDNSREKSTSATGKRMMAHADVIRSDGLELVDLSEQGLTFVPSTTFQSKFVRTS